jgi:hypothetical protein
MDLHLYDWQGKHTLETRQEHLKHAVSWKSLIQKYSIYHPILVGEW